MFYPISTPRELSHCKGFIPVGPDVIYRKWFHIFPLEKALFCIMRNLFLRKCQPILLAHSMTVMGEIYASYWRSQQLKLVQSQLKRRQYEYWKKKCLNSHYILQVINMKCYKRKGERSNTVCTSLHSYRYNNSTGWQLYFHKYQCHRHTNVSCHLGNISQCQQMHCKKITCSLVFLPSWPKQNKIYFKLFYATLFSLVSRFSGIPQQLQIVAKFYF